MLLFEGTNPYNPDLLDLSDLPHPILEKLIQSFLIDRYLILTINEEKKLIQIKFYLVHLYKEKNSWHLEGLDLTSKNKRKFQVDSLEDVEIYPTKSRLSAKQIQEHMTKIEKAPNIIIEMGLEAILQFKKYSPYRLSLFYINPFQTKALLKIVVDVTKQAELVEMANWLLFLGEDMHIKKLPKEIEDYIQTKELVNR